jgi:hypothetical protein
MRSAKSVLTDLHVLLYGFSIEDERCSDDFTPTRNKVAARYRRDGSHAPMHELQTPGHRTEVEELVLRCVAASYQHCVELGTYMTSCFTLAITRLRQLCGLHTDTNQFDAKPMPNFEKGGLQLQPITASSRVGWRAA